MKENAGYLDYSGRDDVLSGGVKLVSVHTPKGDFRVWTKRVGSNPTTKVLLLHGGPGVTHEYFEALDSYFPAAGIEYYYYDQLGSTYSDQPDAPELWELPRFVEEVEQVRQALGLDQSNFCLLGHSWGRYPSHRVCAEVPAAREGSDHLQHDGKHPGLQRVRQQGTHAGNGPDGAGGDQAPGGRRRLREPAVHGTPDSASLRPAHPAHAA